MRTNLESINNEGEEEQILRFCAAMFEYDATEDPIRKEILSEEIRQLKKQLIGRLPEFKNVDCIVAGDKDAERAEFVVCAESTPDAFRVKGTVEATCSKCGVAVLLSPDSPKGPPKMCMTCAIELAEKRDKEEGQDSFGV